MTKLQIDNETVTATSEQSALIVAAQNDSVDLTALAAVEAANRKVAYDKFIELGLSDEVALTVSGYVKNPKPPVNEA
jgi:hypothetical protein